MTIEEYWYLQGIDSKLEKNMLENMIIMDNADMEEEEGQEKNPVLNDDEEDYNGVENEQEELQLDDLYAEDDEWMEVEDEIEEDFLDDAIFTEDEDGLLGDDNNNMMKVGNSEDIEDEYDASNFVNRLRGLLR